MVLGCLLTVLLCLGLGSAVASAAQGDLDPSFGTGGKVVTEGGTAFDILTGVAVQDDGKIVAIGQGFDETIGQSVFTVVRYNRDGSLDMTFDGDGKAALPAGFSAYKVALQPGGKIVIAGSGSDPSANDGGFGVARLNADGSVDTSFGDGDGIVAKQLPPPGGFGDPPSAYAYNVAIQPDGKIVAAGISTAVNFGTYSNAAVVARYTTDGKPDTGFGTDGLETVGIGEESNVPTQAGLALQPDGKSVVAARSNYQDADFFVARFTTAGKLDSSFGADRNGTVTTNLKTLQDEQGNSYPSPDQPNAVAIQNDGKIVAAGSSGGSVTYPSAQGDDSRRDFALVRYNADGSLDTSFDGDGKVVTDFGGADYAGGVALQGDGKIVAAGSNPPGPASGQLYFPPTGDFALARYNPDGSLDAGFGEGGKVTTPFGPGFDGAYDVAIQPDGNIVAAGTTNQGEGMDKADFALARYFGQPPAGPSPGGGGNPSGGGSQTGSASQGGPIATAPPDTTPPGVSRYGVTNNPFVVGGGKTPTFGSAAKSKRHKKGTTFRYTLSEAATVRIVIAQRRSGRRRGRRCVAPTRKLRKARKCIRLTTRGTLTRTSRQGANRVVFSGRIASKTLSPGSYQATLTATDAAKNTSRGQTVAFTIVKR